MSTERNIEKFIDSVINTKNQSFDETYLQSLFDKMSSTELYLFWAKYSSSIALQRAYNAVPHWQTSRQTKLFQYESTRLAFYAREKDANGKYIINKKELETHIVSITKELTQNEIERYQYYKKLPLIKNIETKITLVVVLMIPFLFISMILNEIEKLKIYGRIGLITFTSLYLLVFVFSFIIAIFFKRTNKNKE
jgi:hypothetical protein